MIERKPILKTASPRRIVAVPVMGRSVFFATSLCLLIVGCGKPSAWSSVYGLSSLVLNRGAAAGADRAMMADLARVVVRTLISGLKV
jgi:hypothetical protein